MKQNERIVALDALKGLIMILMALDHANWLLSYGRASEFWGRWLAVVKCLSTG